MILIRGVALLFALPLLALFQSCDGNRQVISEEEQSSYTENAYNLPEKLDDPNNDGFKEQPYNDGSNSESAPPPPVPDVTKVGIKGANFAPGAWASRFQVTHGYLPYQDRETFDRTLAAAISEIKSMGANAIIVSSVTTFVDPDDNRNRDTRTVYFKWLDAILREAVKNGMVVIPSYHPGSRLSGSEYGTWIRTCINSSTSKGFAQKYLRHPNVPAINCPFEAYGRKDVVTADIERKLKLMTAYIHSLGGLHISGPAAGTKVPADTFDIAIEQLNPLLYSDKTKMDAIISAIAKSPRTRAAQFNGYHTELSNNLVEYKLWYKRQMYSMLTYRPHNVIFFDYGLTVSDHIKFGDVTYRWGQPKPYIRRVWTSY